MSLGTALELGRNGITVYRVATEVTGENIANVNTPGYSRQRVILENAPPTTHNGFPLGTGVRIASVERFYDGLLQQQQVNAQTSQGYDTARSAVLQQIEPVFDEVSHDGIGAAISGFFNAWQDLTLNPAGTSERQQVLSTAQILADNFHVASKSLNDTITSQDDALVPLVDDINSSLKDIAQLNSQIRTTEQVSGNANEMRDRRDTLIRELSKKIGISYTENSDGTTDVQFSGTSIVTGEKAGSFTLSVNSTTDNYDVSVIAAGRYEPTLVSPTTGELGAILTLRDSIIPGYLSQVDQLAMTITNQINSLHTTGFDLNNVAGLSFFDSAATDAASFKLNSAITSTNQIAASSSPILPGDNSNASLIVALQNQKLMAGGTYTFNGYIDSLASTIGLAVKTAKTTLSQDEAFTKQLESLRESTSGVSLDEELTNLVKYQRSYQASAKLITTATEMLDVVLGIIR